MSDFDVIVIGAGVVGPCIATALARQGRKVMIVERDWSMPDRIVGELLQPGGLKALRELGMAQAVNNINAIHVSGYYIRFQQKVCDIVYPLKQDTNSMNPLKPVAGCLKNDNDKLVTDSTLDMDEWDQDERVRGVAFRHGHFLSNLRSIVTDEPNVTAVEGTVTKIIRDPENNDIITGVSVKENGESKTYSAKLTICCDGIYSKFRKELSPTNVPDIGSYFVGLELENADLPSPHKGHVFLGDHAPVLIYQISPELTRVLCAYRSTKPPSNSNNDFVNYLQNDVLPDLPEQLHPSFQKAIDDRKFRAMPNQYLSARKQGKHHKGLIMLGDSLNMRHPLTGGGMTVGISDAALLAKLLHPKQLHDLDDHKKLAKLLSQFHTKRKNLDAVINTLSIALYSLFAADKQALKILQRGCFKYLCKGGDYESGPIGLLSGMFPYPMLLFNHFFSVAFYAIYLNFIDHGILGFPIAFVEAFSTIFTAIVVFTPYLWGELV